MKYIIDIPNDKKYAYLSDTDIPSIKFLKIPLCAGENDMKTISIPTFLMLKPYTEPDFSSLVEEAAKATENKVWKFAGEIQRMTCEQMQEAFSIIPVNYDDFCNEMSYQEAKSKYDAWEKQKEEFRVGDEVETESGNKACVLYENPDGTQMFVFKADGTAAWWSKCAIHKTGKNHPEIAELLKKMREE